MVTYMTTIKYTSDAIRDIVESRSNREEIVRALIEKCGGRLVNFYGMIGQDHDIILISEFNQLSDYMGMVMSGALGGAVADWKTIQLYTTIDMMSATETYRTSKDSYSPPPSS